MVPAILTDEKIVTGPNHGDAFGKLTEVEKNGPLTSGFLDCKNNKFITDEDRVIYLKEIIILRHGESHSNQENGPLTEKGKIQAALAADFLLKMQLANFIGFYSPYERCVQTSNIISKTCQIQFSPYNNLIKQQANETTFQERLIETLDFIPERSILITHTDFIQNVVRITNCKSEIGCITNCSITYICKNRIIWLAKEIECTEEST